MRSFSTPRYSKEQEKLIKSEIENNSVLIDSNKGMYKYEDVQFRVKNMNEE